MLQICDFGLAKWKQHAATQTTDKKRRGTVAYMAPEVYKDPGVPRTTTYDVYGFGILLWALLSEEEPFKYGTNIRNILHLFKTVSTGKNKAAWARSFKTDYAIKNASPITFCFTAIMRKEKIIDTFFICVYYDSFKLTPPIFQFITTMFLLLCLQCFDAVGWAAGRASGL